MLKNLPFSCELVCYVNCIFSQRHALLACFDNGPHESGYFSDLRMTVPGKNGTKESGVSANGCSLGLPTGLFAQCSGLWVIHGYIYEYVVFALPAVGESLWLESWGWVVSPRLGTGSGTA